MNGYSFPITCPVDGAPIEAVTQGASSGWTTRAIAKCTRCHVSLVVAVSVVVNHCDERMFGVSSGRISGGPGAAQTAPTLANPGLSGVDMQHTATPVKSA